MALNFLKKEINNKKRKADEMLPASAGNGSHWTTRGDLERERERAYMAEQAKLEQERKAVRANRAFLLERIPFVIFVPVLTQLRSSSRIPLENGQVGRNRDSRIRSGQVYVQSIGTKPRHPSHSFFRLLSPI